MSQVALEILTYLQAHPDAKDSVKGIAQWWVQEDEGVVEKALALLVQEKAVGKRGEVYSLERDSEQ